MPGTARKAKAWGAASCRPIYCGAKSVELERNIQDTVSEKAASPEAALPINPVAEG